MVQFQQLIVGQLPVYINHDHTLDGFVGKAHLRVDESTDKAYITIECDGSTVRALALMLIEHTPVGLSFDYIRKQETTNG